MANDYFDHHVLTVCAIVHAIFNDETQKSEVSWIIFIYYPPEVRRGKYCGLEVFLLQYFPLVKI